MTDQLLQDELLQVILNDSNNILFDVVNTDNIIYPEHIKLKHTGDLSEFETNINYVNKCLKISADSDDYYLIEANIVTKRPIKIIKTSKVKKFLWFYYRINTYNSDENEIIDICESIEPLVNYKKYFQNKKIYYGFNTKTYFICKNNKQLSEIHKKDMQKIQNAYKKMLLGKERELLTMKVQNFMQKNDIK